MGYILCRDRDPVRWKGRRRRSKLEIAMRTGPFIVVSVAALLTFAASAPAQSQSSAPSDNGQSVPDAPQPQKKPAPKPQPPSASADSSHPTEPAEAPATEQPAAKDENAFPEAVSRDAAKAASDAAGSSKPSTANDNPFPEAVSREAAKEAGNDQAPSSAPKSDLPPGVSSSQSSDSLGDTDNPAGVRRKLPNPGRAEKDAQVGSFYLKSGDYQGALLRYQDAMAVDPTNVDAIFGLAETQQMLKKNADAARNYQLYLDILPNGPKSKQALKALKTLQAAK
jgi:tetratricopeptide (TPR) repeat protein